MNSLESTVRTFKRWTGLSSNSALVRSIRPVYDFILNKFYSERGLVRCLNNDEQVYVRPAHRYAHEAYEPPVYSYIKSAIRPGDVVLDIGAHVGLFTILLARWVGVTGRVFAFEPTPLTRAALSDHLALNEVADRVEVVGSAISDRVGEATFHTVSNSPENTLNEIHSRLGTSHELRVPVTTIDAYCDAHELNPTLIKIDIEGYEWHALRGAKETLARCQPQVLLEVHPMNWTEIGESTDTAISILTELGYRALPLEGQTEPLAEYGHVVLEPLR